MAKTSKTVNVSADIGNITSIAVTNGKTFICESRIKKVESNIDDFSQNEKFIFEGEEYLINEGRFENEMLKYTKDNYLCLLYYSIGKCTAEDENNINLVTAIPFSQYKSKKDEMEDFIKKNNKKTIIIDGKKRDITIKNVTVFPEGYSFKAIGDIVNKLTKGLNTVVIDSGGNTTDLAIFDNRLNLKDGKSVRLGLLNLYQNVREYINITHELNISLEDAKRIFNGEQSIMNDTFEYKRELVKRHIITLVNEIKGEVENLKNSNVVLVGGGSEILGSTLKKLYPQTIVCEDITLQAEGLLNIANKIYE